jgi:hypothetical protein
MKHRPLNHNELVKLLNARVDLTLLLKPEIKETVKVMVKYDLVPIIMRLIRDELAAVGRRDRV